jgi:formylglycine-generating enzyme required for sulfatase activity
MLKGATTHWFTRFMSSLFESNGFDRIVRAIRAETAKRQGTEPSTFSNSIGMEFVLIPAGTFMMGSPDSDKVTFSDERPAVRWSEIAECLRL